MYTILRRSPERPAPHGHGAMAASAPLILHMQENRSTLSNEARSAVTALALSLIAGTIVPAFEGLLFVPIAALGGLGVLTFALERHARTAPASETLELVGDLVRHRDSTGRAIGIPARRAQLATLGRAEADLRLFLEAQGTRIEVARCLGQHERREVAVLVRDALSAASGGAAWS
ncbi:DUF2244 domain-containing protein [Sphingomonas sp. R3G8C]|uniref:DUF2244 domain-containing protein n=1 Tax=Novosphingobium rhizosphaerae TaxID=1551649 RepID=UPI00183CEA37